MSFVEIESDAVNTTGRQVSDIAAETKTLVNQIRGDIENITSMWTGTDKDEYVKMALEEASKTDDLLRSLENAGAGLSRTAQNYEAKSEEYRGTIRTNSQDF